MLDYDDDFDSTPFDTGPAMPVDAVTYHTCVHCGYDFDIAKSACPDCGWKTGESTTKESTVEKPKHSERTPIIVLHKVSWERVVYSDLPMCTVVYSILKPDGTQTVERGYVQHGHTQMQAFYAALADIRAMESKDINLRYYDAGDSIDPGKR